jgi:hypothetical protein
MWIIAVSLSNSMRVNPSEAAIRPLFVPSLQTARIPQAVIIRERTIHDSWMA